MDLIAHALYGATLCSRTGLAGGSKRSEARTERRWFSDWTVWCAALFGVLPDVVSMGPPLVSYLLAGMSGNFFMVLDEESLVRYRYMHSLVVALAAAGLWRLVWKPMSIPSLAWALHVAMDALTHGSGKFQTPLFYPLSTWGFDSVRWWRHPGLVLAYWSLLPVIWWGLMVWRRKAPGR